MPISCRLLSLRALSLAVVQAGSQRRSLSTASSKKREMASGKMVMVPLHLSHCGKYEQDEPGAVTKGTVQFGTGRVDCEAVRYDQLTVAAARWKVANVFDKDKSALANLLLNRQRRLIGELDRGVGRDEIRFNAVKRPSAT